MKHPFILCVEIDDTLVLWKDERRKGEIDPDSFEIDEQVLTIMQYCIECSTALVVLWSKGGLEYSSLWAKRLFDTDDVLPLAKTSIEDFCKIFTIKGIPIYVIDNSEDTDYRQELLFIYKTKPDMSFLIKQIQAKGIAK